MISNTKNKTTDLLTATVPTNLPERVASLIGRQNESTAIKKLLVQKEINLITLTGLGGAGKTSLAIQIAHSVLQDFSGGVFFISLASLTKPNLILTEIARTLKIEQASSKKAIEQIKDFLLGRRILLILDNFEHLIEGAIHIQELLQTSANLKIIVTSREPLKLRNEQIYPIDVLENDFAVELFIKRAQSLNPNLFISTADKEAIFELCNRLDRLPLAIELAALRTKLFSPTALLTRLQPDLQPDSRILNLISTGTRDMPERQQSLRNTIAWSYELLEVQEQKVFRAASIFPAGFRVDSISTLLKLDEAQTLEIISSLVDKNLLRPSLEKHKESYFTMVEMIREFAWDEIIKLKELNEMKNAYVNLYLDLLRQADIEIKEKQTTNLFSVFGDEFANINLVLEICTTSPQGSENWTKGYQILKCFYHYWMMYQSVLIDVDYITRARKSMDDFIQANPHQAENFLLYKADIYSLSGSLAWLVGSYTQAVNLHEVAYETYQKIQNEKGILETLNNLSANWGCLGDYVKALDLLEKSTVISRKLGDQWAELRNLSNMGLFCQYTETPERAFKFYETGLKIANELQDKFFIALMNYGISSLYVRLKKYDEAIKILKLNLESGRELQGAFIYVHALVIYARANIMLGKQEPATKSILEAIELSEKITDVDVKVDILYICIHILGSLGIYSESVQLFGSIQQSRASTQMQENPYDARDFEKVLQKIKSSLSVNEFEMLNDIGSKLTLDAAIAFASEILETFQTVAHKKDIPLQLTTREHEVLQLIAQGKTNEQISNELVVVLKTVEKHVASIFRKLDVKNRTEAATWALANEIK